MGETTPDRLDSWKAIASYLGRDAATVRRWEKTRGLPVRRVGSGPGASVYAYAAELDAWLKAAPPQAPVHRSIFAAARWRWAAIASAATVAIVFVWTIWPRELRADQIRVEASNDGVVASDLSGGERWRYQFPAAYRHFLTADTSGLQMTADPRPAVYIATSFQSRRTDGVEESGELRWLNLRGELQRSFGFTDEVTFGRTRYGPPWIITSFAVDDTTGTRRIAVTSHHHRWDPGLVTVLDEKWQRHGTFVHAGWVDWVRWLTPDRLLIGGFSNAHDGGMIALLDATALDGQGAEPPGSPHHCDSCPNGRPLRMIVMPRTELNVVTASRFNRAVVQMLPDRIVARTVEMPSDQGAIDALYEFTLSLELIASSFSLRYWEAHRALEAQGKLNHTAENCPERDGPRRILTWEAATGWKTRSLR